jgi:nucleoside-diphosphate kinase
MEHTLCIIKPDATRRALTGEILALIESQGLKIKALKWLHLSRKEAQDFYIVHKERPFYSELVEMMISHPVTIAVLEAPGAVEKYRNLMGATNPAQATAGTIRAKYAISMGENSVHGSDSLENAQKEISYFFSQREIF